jgi:hypothetical protein
MPRDGSLRFLGHSPLEILVLWRECAARIAASGGVVFLLTHCEEGFSGNAPMLEIYKAFMTEIGEDERFIFMKPDALLDHLEARSK